MPLRDVQATLVRRQQGPLRIGLLLCGDTPETLQPRFGSYADCLIQRFQLTGPRIHVRTWRAWHGELPDHIHAADAYVVGGSPASVLDQEDWIERLGAFIRQAHRAEKRLLGICFGHQLIHHALGGKVSRAAKGWGLGVYSVDLDHPMPGLAPRKAIALRAMHRDQVVRPAFGLARYAGTDFCPYYLTGRANSVLTVQGHPEFTSDFFHAFLYEIRSRFDDDEFGRAVSSLEKPTDSQVVCQSINQFLLAETLAGKEVAAP